MENKKKSDIKQKKLNPTEVALSIARQDYDNYINTDPLGSWTGVPDDKYDVPVQDADDL